MSTILASLVLGAVVALVGASGAAAADPTSSPARPSASVTPRVGLPRPDRSFEGESCPPDELCARLPVDTWSHLAETGEVPCGLDPAQMCVLHADLVAPRGDGGPWPIVVMAAGGPQPPDGSALLTPTAQLLAANGAVVLVGSWRQGTRYGATLSVGLGDLACGIRTARALAPLVGGDPARVTLVGHSLGAWAGSLLMLDPSAMTQPDGCLVSEGDGAPDAFVGLAGPYSLIADRTDVATFASIIGGTPKQAKAAWLAADPLAQAGRSTAPAIPTTLIHGLADRTVDPQASLRFAEALTSAGRPVRLITVAGVNHPGLVSDTSALTEILRIIHAPPVAGGSAPG